MRALFCLMALAFSFILNPLAGAEPPHWKKKLQDFETFRIQCLRRDLGLSGPGASRLLELLGRLAQERQRVFIEHRRALEELEAMLSQKAPEEAILAQINRIEETMKEMERLRWKEWEGIKRMLPPDKQAHYLLLQERFFRQYWEQLRERHGR